METGGRRTERAEQAKELLLLLLHACQILFQPNQ